MFGLLTVHGTFRLQSGQVTIAAHGTTVPAEVRLGDVRREDGGTRFLATARLDRTSFGVTKKKGMVGRTVDLVIDATGQPV